MFAVNIIHQEKAGLDLLKVNYKLNIINSKRYLRYHTHTALMSKSTASHLLNSLNPLTMVVNNLIYDKNYTRTTVPLSAISCVAQKSAMTEQPSAFCRNRAKACTQARCC